MATYVEMQQRIANELARDDLSASEIPDAIQDAIKYHQRMRFFISQKLDTSISTVANVALYNLPSDLIVLDELYSTQAGTRFPLRWINYEDLLELDTQQPSLVAPPYYYSIFNKQFSLWPVPDAVYPMTLLYQFLIPAPANDADGANPTDPSYFWLNDAERMIRTYAKHILAADVLRDDERAQTEFLLYKRALANLQEETNERVMTGTVEPWDPQWRLQA